MQWIHAFDLFLFDFDGLLVNTEHLHYQAYLNMLTERGYQTHLSLSHFFQLAHLNSSAWREALYADIPDLEPNWQKLYDEKSAHYERLICSGKVELMPGVEPLLRALEKADMRRCVVTNSRLPQVQLIRSQIAILQTLPKWVTREDYEKSKPSPECYFKAISLYGKTGDRIIGFEDSIRGLKALRQTPATAVIICPKHYPLLEIALEEGGVHFESMQDVRFGY
ncbi:MAG: HAD family phosphatase [Verrucomicrobia bacterium]|nr:HAD family phosphatase [Verrucomicrobiota bacterium]MDE3047477.1 HAD family phosphatase [Verrucomicrobiota bacterium]